MKHICNLDQYCDVYRLTQTIREGYAVSLSMLGLIQSGSHYIRDHIGPDIVMSDEITRSIQPSHLVRECGQRILDNADRILHMLKRELCYYNLLTLKQEVPAQYQDTDLPRDLSESEDGEVIEMPRLDLPDQELRLMLDDIDALEFWYDSVGEITYQYVQMIKQQQRQSLGKKRTRKNA